MASRAVTPSAMQRDLEKKMCVIFDELYLECRPIEVYRMSKYKPSHVCKVKVVLPSKSHCAIAPSSS